MMIIFGVRTTDGNYGPFEFYEDAYEFALKLAEQHGDPAPIIETFTDDWSASAEEVIKARLAKSNLRNASTDIPRILKATQEGEG